MYGFKKTPHLQAGTLNNATQGASQFSCDDFQRDQPQLEARDGKKKMTSPSDVLVPSSSIAAAQTSAFSPDQPTLDFSKAGYDPALNLSLPAILQTLASIQEEQKVLISEFADLKQHNQLLWQEAVNARQRADRQEEAIGKMIRFLGRFVKMNSREGRNVEQESGAQILNHDEESERGKEVVLHRQPQPDIAITPEFDVNTPTDLNFQPENHHDQFMTLFNEMTPNQVNALVTSYFPPQPYPSADPEQTVVHPSSITSPAATSVTPGSVPDTQVTPSHLLWTTTDDIEKDVDIAGSNIQDWVDDFAHGLQASAGATQADPLALGDSFLDPTAFTGPFSFDGVVEPFPGPSVAGHLDTSEYSTSTLGGLAYPSPKAQSAAVGSGIKRPVSAAGDESESKRARIG
ncbi:hypothetical protein DL96DRAFT_1594159 [Flagelloscypha sp. PMI_526]|nr:hypothetical protein DL96DRAFT_1594159 [Flagelloscypha sp. PMI_526]